MTSPCLPKYLVCQARSAASSAQSANSAVARRSREVSSSDMRSGPLVQWSQAPGGHWTKDPTKTLGADGGLRLVGARQLDDLRKRVGVVDGDLGQTLAV